MKTKEMKKPTVSFQWLGDLGWTRYLWDGRAIFKEDIADSWWSSTHYSLETCPKSDEFWDKYNKALFQSQLNEILIDK